jgi:hypothetical protein
MAKWAEVKAHWAWLNDHLADDEPVVFKLPRREARKRIQNAEKKRRIILQTDEQNYSEFQVWNEAYMYTLGENPTLRTQAIIEAMKQFDVKGWYEAQKTTTD